jgi:hypothetical protein
LATDYFYINETKLRSFMSNLENSNGNSYNYGDSHNGHGNGSEPPSFGNNFEEDADHEHTFVNIVETANLAAYEELVHQVVTLEFHDRGLTLDLSLAEAEELGQVLAEIMAYLGRKRAFGS